MARNKINIKGKFKVKVISKEIASSLTDEIEFEAGNRYEYDQKLRAIKEDNVLVQ